MPALPCLSGGRRCPSRHSDRRLASPPALVRGRCLLPPHLPLALAARRRRPGEFRRTHHPTLDAEILTSRKGYVDHPQQVHALRETVLRATTSRHDRFLSRAGHAGDTSNCNDLAGAPGAGRCCERGRPEHLHALFDAGAGKSDAGVRALWDLAEQHPEPGLSPCVPVAIRTACGRGSNCPAACSSSHRRAGRVCRRPAQRGPPGRDADGAQGRGAAEQAVRTIVCREFVPGPKKDRWHPLFTHQRGRTAEEVLPHLPARGNTTSKAYRVEVHDRVPGRGAVWLRQGESRTGCGRVSIGVRCR